MVTPRITNKLRGSLGEIYYKEYCDQKGWAYTSLENLYESKNSKWIFTFKKGFRRIKIAIPKEIRIEVNLLANPTNNSFTSPSFVFDFLACKVGNHKNYSEEQPSDNFAWVECKTGSAVFTSNQINTMSRITLPLAIFHTSDVLEKPELIHMDCDIKSGKEWMDEFTPIDNEIYEFAERKLKSQFSNKISQKERVIFDAKNFIQENYEKFSDKQVLLKQTTDTLMGTYHLGDQRLQNYLKIAIADLRINHNLDLDENNQRERKYSIKETQKKYPMAWEAWRESDDEFLKKYWNEKSNQQNRSEIIQELSKKLGRKPGGIISRLKKLKLD